MRTFIRIFAEEMIDYKLEIMDRNSAGDTLRCPHCGQVLAVMNSVDGFMTVTIQCRRCHSFVGVDAYCK